MRNLPASFLSVLLLLPLVLLASCVTYTPFEQIRSRVPEARFVRLPSGQLVHLLQEGEGEAVLLLHGFGSSSWAWRGVIPGLAGEFRVLAPDLNGFGWTERPESFDSYTGEGQIEMLLSLLDTLGVGRVHVVGHSYGGALALTLAHRHPQRVRSLVLLDAAHPSYLDGRRKKIADYEPFLELYLRSVALRPRRVRNALERVVYDDGHVDREMVHAYLDRLKVEGATRAYHGLTAPRQTGREPVVFEEIEIPTRVLWGEEDTLVSVEMGLAASKRIAGFESFVTLPETGHAPHEERPGVVTELILDFLGTL